MNTSHLISATPAHGKTKILEYLTAEKLVAGERIIFMGMEANPNRIYANVDAICKNKNLLDNLTVQKLPFSKSITYNTLMDSIRGYDIDTIVFDDIYLLNRSMNWDDYKKIISRYNLIASNQLKQLTPLITTTSEKSFISFFDVCDIITKISDRGLSAESIYVQTRIKNRLGVQPNEIIGVYRIKSNKNNSYSYLKPIINE